MLYTSLVDYYKTIDILIEYKYPPEYVESLIPFEREVFVNLVMKALKESNNNNPDQPEAPPD